jgi:hypothetical protein
MGGLKNTVEAGINDGPFPLRVVSPEHKHHPFTLAVYHLNHSIGKMLPTLTLMATRSTAFHRQHAIEE